ncbi:response regulator transcription factor [Nocardioides litoris]|uniref:response regulator transcription factor n=1 Tax=Nocardioides litoris TaxID=1926648 RepID=UPI00111EACCB|nr:response regulator transcription factor [Nocardioides litoris]
MSSRGAVQGRKTILAVDDEPDVLELLSVTLGTTGHQVRTAATGQEALAHLDGADLLVVDVMMPGLSGLDLARRVSDGPTPRPRILMLSALGSPDDVRRGYDAGADDYLAKPFAVRELVDRALALLDRPA